VSPFDFDLDFPVDSSLHKRSHLKKANSKVVSSLCGPGCGLPSGLDSPSSWRQPPAQPQMGQHRKRKKFMVKEAALPEGPEAVRCPLGDQAFMEGVSQTLCDS
jgi:hypothetical protein